MSGLIDKYIREIFEERKVSEELREKLWKHYFGKLSAGIDEGYPSSFEFYDEDLANRLKQNIAEFSAFKETAFHKELENLLVEDGHVLPWSEYKDKAYQVSGDYNGRYLETEYHQTVATANMASKFQDFQANKELYPNLKFVTVNDSRVRPEHKAFDGVVKPIDDAFWSTHLPPLDWGCRCDVEQTDEEPTEAPPASESQKTTFKNNASQSGKIFLSEAYSVDFTDLEKDQTSIKSLKLLAHNSDSAIQQFAREKVCELPRSKQFEVIQERKKGKITEHILLNKGEDYPNIKNVAQQFLKDGSKNIEIMPEINAKSLHKFREKIYPNYDLMKNPDLRIDGKYYDVKRVESLKNIQRNANRASEQKAIAVLDYQGDDLTEEKMKQQAKRIFGKNNINDKGEHNYPMDTLYFSHKGKLHKYNRE